MCCSLPWWILLFLKVRYFGPFSFWDRSKISRNPFCQKPCRTEKLRGGDFTPSYLNWWGIGCRWGLGELIYCLTMFSPWCLLFWCACPDVVPCSVQAFLCSNGLESACKSNMPNALQESWCCPSCPLERWRWQ